MPTVRIWHVIGNSGSILEEPHLKDCHPSIGVNRILEYMTTDYLLIVDPNVRKEQERFIKHYTGKIITWERMAWKRPVLTFALTERWPHIGRFEGPYVRAGNTGLYAIEFAARQIHPQKGKIILHGLDFAKKKGKAKSHFYGDGDKRGTGSGGWGRAVESLKQSAKFLKEHGIRILNASPWRGTPIDKFLPNV
jgi:hypothetical protein